MLELLDIEKYYSVGNIKEKILKGISLEFLDGEFNMIIGPSGSGKSTLLNIISGLDKKFTGKVVYDSINSNDLDIDKYRGENIGFIFQNFNLIEHLTVRENINMAVYLKGDAKSKEKRLKEVLKKLSIYEQIDKLPSQLSGGQKQRVAIARAIINDPKIIIADEPTGALDSKTSLEIMDILKKLSDEGKTVIMVTHDESLLSYADKVIKIKDGQLDYINVQSSLEIKDNINNVSERKSNLAFSNLFKIVCNNIKTRKFRNFIVSFATAIGVMAVLRGLAFGTGIEKKMKSVFETSTPPEAVVVSAKTDDDQQGFNFNRELTIEEQSEIKDMFKEEGVTRNSEKVFLLYSSIEYEGKHLNKRQVGAIAEFGSFDNKDEIYNSNDGVLLVGNVISEDKEGTLIPENIAKQMLDIDDKDELSKEDANKLLHKDLTIVKEDTVSGEVNRKEYSVEISGIIKTDSGLSDMKISPIYLSKAAMDEGLNKFDETREVYGYTFFTDNAKESNSIVSKFKDNKKFTFTNVDSVAKSISKSINLIKASVTFIASLSLIVAAILIAIVLFNGVLERTKEIGVMRAIGYKKKSIIQIFLYESVFTVFLSNIIALILSFLVVGMLNKELESMTAFKDIIVINPVSICFVLIFSELVAVIAAIYPSFKAARVDPIEVLR